MTCKYEGVVETNRSKYGIQNVATNTMHVPMRQGSSHHTIPRYMVWRYAAKQYLTEEDRIDKRGPRQGTQEDKTIRMANVIMSYHCRRNR